MSATSTDQEMTYMHEYTTMIGSDDILASDVNALNDRLPLELPLESFEGMDLHQLKM